MTTTQLLNSINTDTSTKIVENTTGDITGTKMNIALNNIITWATNAVDNGNAPSGPAGGVLSGNFPTPGFASIAAHTMFGNFSAVTGTPTALSASQIKTLLSTDSNPIITTVTSAQVDSYASPLKAGIYEYDDSIPQTYIVIVTYSSGSGLRTQYRFSPGINIGISLQERHSQNAAAWSSWTSIQDIIDVTAYKIDLSSTAEQLTGKIYNGKPIYLKVHVVNTQSSMVTANGGTANVVLSEIGSSIQDAWISSESFYTTGGPQYSRYVLDYQSTSGIVLRVVQSGSSEYSAQIVNHSANNFGAINHIVVEYTKQ